MIKIIILQKKTMILKTAKTNREKVPKLNAEFTPPDARISNPTTCALSIYPFWFLMI